VRALGRPAQLLLESGRDPNLGRILINTSKLEGVISSERVANC
jgi:hypothetical protein